MPSEASEGQLPGLTVRPAGPRDADALADLFLAARRAAEPAIPRLVHPAADVRRWVHGWFDDPVSEPWVGEEHGRPVGLLLLQESWVHSLYVAPDRTGHGIGSVLLQLAKSLRPDRLGLWVFESNEGARRFYARHGFVEVRRTDGSDNEERAPDVELGWTAEGPLSLLRGRIDEVDDRLAEVLAERARLTAAVQQVKAVPGHAGRDPDREAEIAERMAARAPALGAARLRRIMDTVIRESLDAAAEEHAGLGPRP